MVRSAATPRVSNHEATGHAAIILINRNFALRLGPVRYLARLIVGPVRLQDELQAGLERQNADLTGVLGDLDRPVPGRGRMLLRHALDEAGGEQHGIDIVGQRRAVVAVAIDGT